MKDVKTLIFVILGLVLFIYILHREDTINKLESKLNYLETNVTIKVKEGILERERYITDSLIKVLDNTELPKKPDTIYIIKDVIKYEKSKNSILDSVSIYQYFWSSSQLDSMYSK